MRNAIVAALVVAVALAGCADSESTAENTQVTIATNKGDFVVELYDQEAPITSENFARYVIEGFYDGTSFHRIVNKGGGSAIEVVQGGGMDRATGQEKETRAPIRNEAATSGVKNEAMTLSMARTSAPHSATSQFFINTEANPTLDANGGSAGYAVFARVVEGQDVVRALQDTPVGAYQPGLRCFPQQAGDCPQEEIYIESARITREGPAAEAARAAIIHEEEQANRPPDLALGLITPGRWAVNTPEDHIMVWAQNRGGQAPSLTWNMTGEGGAPLPEGWQVSFAPATLDLEPEGTLGSAGFGAAYEDWGFSIATLTLPEDAAGTHDVEFRLGDAVLPATVEIVGPGQVSDAGSSVHVTYRGTFQDSGEEFDAGEFDATLGEGGFIPGFDFGLIGLADGEEAQLVIPPALGYGLEGTGSPGREQFHGETLVFDVSISGV